jgi:hypothetical protein
MIGTEIQQYHFHYCDSRAFQSDVLKVAFPMAIIYFAAILNGLAYVDLTIAFMNWHVLVIFFCLESRRNPKTQHDRYSS